MESIFEKNVKYLFWSTILFLCPLLVALTIIYVFPIVNNYQSVEKQLIQLRKDVKQDTQDIIINKAKQLEEILKQKQKQKQKQLKKEQD